MKKKITLIVSSYLFVVLQSHQFGIKSTGAPPSSTGAPSETSCAQAGCHSTSALNSGGATVNFDFGQTLTEYIPGQTYPVTIQISDSSSPKFGFQIVALREYDNSNAGTFSLINNSRTQIINGAAGLSNREYVTYTSLGQFPQNAGVGAWSFNWTAPPTDIGPVKFYLATVAADGDETDNGDFVFTNEYTVNTSSANAVNEIQTNLLKLNVFPNPVSNVINISLQINKDSKLKLVLMDIKGCLQQLFFDERVDAGAFEGQFLPRKDLSAGIYLLKAETADQSIVKSICFK